MATFNNGESLASVRTKINDAIDKIDGNATISNDISVGGNITVTGTVDGRDVAADGTKLDGVEASADVTDTANVTAAGALMDSELTSEASVKALDQGVATTDSPTFAGLTVDTDTLYVDSTNDRVGINTSSPAAPLEVDGGSDIAFFDGTNVRLKIQNPATGDLQLNSSGAGDSLTFATVDTEAMRIDSSQQVLIGYDSSVAVNSFENKLQVTHSGYATASLTVYRNGSDGAGLNFAHSRSGTVGTNTILQDGDAFGHLYFLGADGTDFASRGAAIISRVDGTPGSNDMPGRIEFLTTADGASDVTERMRINNEGHVGIGGAADPDQPLHLTAEPPVFRMTNPQGTVTLGVSMGKIEWETRDAGAPGVIGYIDVVDSNNFGTAFDMKFASGASGSASEAMRINSQTYVVISSTGNTRGMSLGSTTSRLTIEGTSATLGRAGAAAVHNTNDTSGPVYYLAKSRGTANNSNTIVLDDDYLGQLNWNGADGTQMVQAGNISLRVDGTPGVEDMPGRLVFMTTADGAASPTERMRISNNGNVTIGDTSDLGRKLGVYGDAYITGGYLEFGGSESTPTTANPTLYRNNPGAGANMVFATEATEAMRIDQSQRLLIGHTSSIPNGGDNQQLQVTGTGSSDGISLARFNTTFGAYFTIGRSGSGTVGTYTAVPINDEIGRMQWAVADGTDMSSVGAMINAVTEQEAASNDVPTRLVFSTTSDGAASPTERMRITSSGDVRVEKNLTVKNQNALYFDNTGGYSPRLSNASDQAALSSFINNSESLRLNSSCLAVFSSGQFANTYGNSTRTNLQVDGSSEAIITLSKGGAMRGYFNATDSRMDVAASSGNELRFIPNGATAEAITMTTGGNLKFTSGRGIDFSATGDATGATSEILDDYEEGTWSPTLFTGATQATLEHQGGSNVQGVYTKIGRQVTLHAEVDVNNLNGGTGLISVQNLPYSVGDLLYPTGIEASGSVSYYNVTAALSSISCYANSGNKIEFEVTTSGTQAASATMTGTHLGTGEFRFTITYFTS